MAMIAIATTTHDNYCTYTTAPYFLIIAGTVLPTVRDILTSSWGREGLGHKLIRALGVGGFEDVAGLGRCRGSPARRNSIEQRGQRRGARARRHHSECRIGAALGKYNSYI